MNSSRLKLAMSMAFATTDTYHLHCRTTDFSMPSIKEKPFYQKLNDKNNKRRFTKGGK